MNGLGLLTKKLEGEAPSEPFPRTQLAGRLALQIHQSTDSLKFRCAGLFPSRRVEQALFPHKHFRVNGHGNWHYYNRQRLG